MQVPIMGTMQSCLQSCICLTHIFEVISADANTESKTGCVFLLKPPLFCLIEEESYTFFESFFRRTVDVTSHSDHDLTLHWCS